MKNPHRRPFTAPVVATVPHDLNLAARYCDQIVRLDKGRLSCAGSVEHVLTPAVLEPDYGVSVRSVPSEDTVQLIFSPLN